MRGVCPGPSSSSRFPGGELQSSAPAAELHTHAGRRRRSLLQSPGKFGNVASLCTASPRHPPTSAPFSGLWRLPSLPRRGAGRPRPAEEPQRRGREPASLSGAGRGDAAGDPAAAAAALAGRGRSVCAGACVPACACPCACAPAAPHTCVTDRAESQLHSGSAPPSARRSQSAPGLFRRNNKTCQSPRRQRNE